MTTAAGSLALAGAGARKDAFIATRLRAAGAIILGKANMTEFANFMAIGMPAGYSSLGGQVLNPYALELDDNRIPLVPPGGSSSGSAVAVAAGLAPIAVGTETSGSLLSPATANGVVTIKPTVGLVSRSGIVPIAESQDTAGPLTLTVRDAAILLGAISGFDPEDPATRASIGRSHGDYTPFLDAQRIKGARIGWPRAPGDAVNDVYYGALGSEQAAILAEAVECLRDLGATVIEAPLTGAGRVGGPGSTIEVPVTSPFSQLKGKSTPTSTVFLYEFKNGLDAYLRDYALAGEVKSLADVIRFNAAAERALRFGQDLLIAAEATSGDLAEPLYRSARAFDLESAKGGLDRYFEAHRLDAMLVPARIGAHVAAKAGYPSVSVPAGFVTTLDGRETPACPFNITFTGQAFSEPVLIALAYAYEQATHRRRPPQSAPPGQLHS
jgi:amidase